MSMFYTMQNSRPKPDGYVVRCKRESCARNTPAGVAEMPTSAIVVTCKLCGEVRRYRPSEINLGQYDPLLKRGPQRQELAKHLQYRRRG